MTETQSSGAAASGESGRSSTSSDRPEPAEGRPSGASRLKKVLARIGYALFLALLAVGTVKFYDLYLVKTRSAATTGNVIPDAASEDPAASMSLYPYTGFHGQSHCRLTSMDLMGRRLPAVDIRSGDCGFFIDFNLQNPPAKAPREFRIILIGGSAAQGLGGLSNEDMFYKRLEAKLNAVPAGEGGKASVRIINLAMAGSITYQNYLALNRWGHPLQPDLILSFSGHNDLAIPYQSQNTDIPFCMKLCMGFVEASKNSSSGGTLKWLTRQLPGIFGRTQVGAAVRLLRLDERTAAAVVQYRASGAVGELYGSRLYIHALKSIKRDFDGIPILVSLQPTREEEVLGEHASLARMLQTELKGYKNDDWYFLDVQRKWIEQGLFDRSPPLLLDQCHFTSAGQQVVAAMLAEELAPVIQALRSRKPAETSERGPGAKP